MQAVRSQTLEALEAGLGSAVACAVAVATLGIRETLRIRVNAAETRSGLHPQNAGPSC